MGAPGQAQGAPTELRVRSVSLRKLQENSRPSKVGVKRAGALTQFAVRYTSCQYLRIQSTRILRNGKR